MTKDPVTTAALMTCAYCNSAHGFSSTPEKLVTWNEPSASLSYATGCCIHAFAAVMKYPDSQDPTKTATPDSQCSRGPSRFSPKRKRPRNADSRKKEKTP